MGGAQKEKAPQEDTLEFYLERLRKAENENSLLLILLVFLVLPVVFLGFIGALLYVLIIIGLLILVGKERSPWIYQETITVKNAGREWRKIAEDVPRLFQRYTLQNIVWNISGNKLTINLNLETSVIEHSRYGSYARGVDLGPFRVEALFEDKNGDLVVQIRYHGEPPVMRGSIAAEQYEKIIMAFRLAVEDACAQQTSQSKNISDFAQLAEILASKGIVVAEVRCPYCGASIELPKEGDTVKCPYCGATLKVIDVYKLLLEIFREEASQESRKHK
jgi:lysine biosynthesis protein LysW